MQDRIWSVINPGLLRSSAQSKQLRMRNGGKKGIGRLPAQHSARGFDRAGHHNRDHETKFLPQAIDRQQAGFDVARIWQVSSRRISAPPSRSAFDWS